MNTTNAFSSGVLLGLEGTVTAPDVYDCAKGVKPSDHFVLCRDSNGKPTAVYGQNRWDFTPYSLECTKQSVRLFDGWTKERNDDVSSLIRESKWLVFIGIYLTDKAKTGRYTPSTINNYIALCRKLMAFCYSYRDNPLVGVLSIKKVLEQPVWLNAFILSDYSNKNNAKQVKSLLCYLYELGTEYTDHTIPKECIELIKRTKDKQHPVIPTRLYFQIMESVNSQIEYLLPYTDKLTSFISEFKDPFYGRRTMTQRFHLSERAGDNIRSEFFEGISSHGVKPIFEGHYSAKDANQLTARLAEMQYNVAIAIHLYTGMRFQEVMRLPYDCIAKEEVPGVVASVVDVISTTTKFTGFKTEVSWLAPPDVLKAIRVARSIVDGLASVIGFSPSKMPLFTSPACIKRKVVDGQVNVVRWTAENKPKWLEALIIQPRDLAELRETDPDRDWSNEVDFEVGRKWPLQTHQFRRSLAFYAANSGLISLPSLKRQFKHLSLAMTRYYTNNFEKMISVFGVYNTKTKKHELPSGHIINEFQAGMPVATARMLYEELLASDHKLFGRRGGYLERSKQKLSESGDAQVLEFRKQTEKMVKNGDISYKETLLGGCTKVGACETFMLGKFSACLTCDEGIISQDKVKTQISELRDELKEYEQGSGEYQITVQTLEEYEAFIRHKERRSA